MTAYNVVRFRVKPGREDEFIAAHRDMSQNLSGFRGGALIKTGDRSFCLIGEWSSFDKMAAARPKMIGVLDGFRDILEDLGGGLGVTDPVSGEAVMALKPGKTKKKKKAPKEPAKKAEAEKTKPKEIKAKKTKAKPPKANEALTKSDGKKEKKRKDKKNKKKKPAE